MTVAAEKKKHFFVSSYRALSLTMQAEDWTAVEGRAVRVKPIRIEFMSRPHPKRPRDPNVNPYRGEYSTSDEKKVEFIRSHPYFQNEPYHFERHVNGRGIWELDHDPDALTREALLTVRAGAIDSGKKSPIADAPEEPVQEAPRAKISVGKKSKAQ